MIQDLTTNNAFTRRRNNVIGFNLINSNVVVATNLEYREVVITGDFRDRELKTYTNKLIDSENGIGVRECHRCGLPITLTPWNVGTLSDGCLCQRCNIELEQQCSGNGWRMEEKPWLFPNDENTRPLDNIFVWD